MRNSVEGVFIPAGTGRINDAQVFYAKNLCVWFDGTIRGALGHNGTCEWGFDGQVFFHKKLLTNVKNQSTIKSNQGSNRPEKGNK